MTISEDLDRTRAALLALEKALMALRNRVGPHLDVLRLLDDLERCTADLRRLEQQVRPAPLAGELVAIPDDDYDPDFWADAEHEGLG
ncbi:hypothetical protein EV651_10148 [Kribbella sp. VKM Ac-2571]|uniref:hypothetical protein n=1 Tax=Kribbella sp. VKM Ac-2571 TaxID=2512222 RepID=UPI0010601359|nr:hypothetical protein [Kribbella sp. VKM Ac-2571]TDO69012.1 hypothetical protein EV651_10148 [Kribbella sp. VKM Ac-2571]